MNILVTGSNGFVGSQLMWELEEKGHKVFGIDISPHCNIKTHPKTQMGDIRKLNDLLGIDRLYRTSNPSGFDLVIHCAAAKHDFGISRAEYYSHNKTGTKVLVAFMEEMGIKRLINISTVGVFGHPTAPADEDEPYNPDHPYGASKLEGEKLAIAWQAKDSCRELIALRPAIIYGPNNFTNVYKLISMMHKHPWVTIGKGEHVKGIISIRSVLDMIYFCIDYLKPGYEHFNAADLPYLTLRELMDLIAQNPSCKYPRFRLPLSIAIGIGYLFDIPSKLMNIDLPVNSDRMRKLATATHFLSEKIRAAGFVQTQSTEDSIRETVMWYLQHKEN